MVVTQHGSKRIKEREIHIKEIKETLKKAENIRIRYNEEIAVIDEEKNITIILTQRESILRIITVLPKSNVWIKKGTKIIKV